MGAGSSSSNNSGNTSNGTNPGPSSRSGSYSFQNFNPHNQWGGGYFQGNIGHGPQSSQSNFGGIGSSSYTHTPTAGPPMVKPVGRDILMGHMVRSHSPNFRCISRLNLGSSHSSNSSQSSSYNNISNIISNISSNSIRTWDFLN